MSGKIYAPLKSNTLTGDPNDSENTYADISRTELPNSKAGLDVFQAGSISHILELANVLIKGTLPEVNFDRIIKTTVSATAQTLAFVYAGSYQFYIDATTVYGDFDVSIRTTSAFTLDAGLDNALLENGDTLIQEG